MTVFIGLDPGADGAVSALLGGNRVLLVIAWRYMHRKSGGVWQVVVRRDGGEAALFEEVPSEAELLDLVYTHVCAVLLPYESTGLRAGLVVEGLRPFTRTAKATILHLGQSEGAQRRTLEMAGADLVVPLAEMPLPGEWRREQLGVNEQKVGSEGCEGAAIGLWRMTLQGVSVDDLPAWAQGHAAESAFIGRWGWCHRREWRGAA